GGGGLTSMRRAGDAHATTRVGAGGGGGMQFADGWRFAGRSYDGLGLGAGVSSEESAVEYSYSDSADSGRRPKPRHRYDPRIVADYAEQLRNLHRRLRNRYRRGDVVVLEGGGGMGGGTEYVRPNGE